jgi:hypothetical protein
MSGETSWPVEERRHPFPIECLNTCEANGKKGRAAGLCIGHALVVVGDLVHREHAFTVHATDIESVITSDHVGECDGICCLGQRFGDFSTADPFHGDIVDVVDAGRHAWNPYLDCFASFDLAIEHQCVSFTDIGPILDNVHLTCPLYRDVK